MLLFPRSFQANLAAVGVLADRLIHHTLLVGVRAADLGWSVALNDLAELEARTQAARLGAL